MVTNSGVSDTDPHILDMQVRIWRGMSSDERVEVVNNLNRDAERMAETGVRSDTQMPPTEKSSYDSPRSA